MIGRVYHLAICDTCGALIADQQASLQVHKAYHATRDERAMFTATTLKVYEDDDAKEDESQ